MAVLLLTGLYKRRTLHGGFKLSKYSVMMAVHVHRKCSEDGKFGRSIPVTKKLIKQQFCGNTLSEQDQIIRELHQKACQTGDRTYLDPFSGYKVFTEFAHKERGKCCGSACRHCPYGQINVKDSAMKKTFNSSFYV